MKIKEKDRTERKKKETKERKNRRINGKEALFKAKRKKK